MERYKKKSLGKKCEICKSKESLLLHHFSYKDIYKPKISAASKNTITLCYSCHDLVHKIQHERNWKFEQTELIVNELKKEISKAHDIYHKIESEWLSKCLADA